MLQLVGTGTEKAPGCECCNKLCKLLSEQWVLVMVHDGRLFTCVLSLLLAQVKTQYLPVGMAFSMQLGWCMLRCSTGCQVL